MPTPRPGSDRLRLELDILASELDGDEIRLAAPAPSPGAPPEASDADDSEPGGATRQTDGDLPTHAC